MPIRLLQILLISTVLSCFQLSAELQPRDRIIVQTLIKLNRFDVSGNEKWKGAVERYAESVRGTEEHLDIVSKFKVEKEYPKLIQLILEKPQGAQSTNAVKLLFNLEAQKLISDSLNNAKPEQAEKLMNPASATLLSDFIISTKSETLRKAAANSLLSVGDEKQKEMAKKHLNSAPQTTATSIDVAKLSKLTGDPAKGKAVYAKLCFACHVAENVGIDYGPALSEIGDKLPKSELYTAIIDPSAGVSFNYEGWVIQMNDGTSAAGIIHSETDNDITLRMAGGLRQSYPKNKVKSREKMKTSLMPPGLHLALKQDELIDLIEYLASLKKKK